MRRLTRCVLLSLLICVGEIASASPVILTYSGNVLDDPGGPGCPPPTICTRVTSISGQVLIDLDFDTGGQSIDYSARVVRYQFTDGATTITQGTPDYEEQLVFNIAQGEIIGWGIRISQPQPFFAGEHDLLLTAGGDITDPRGLFRIERDVTEYCVTDNGTICTQSGWLESIGNPGDFTVRRIPEPSSLALLGVGLAGLAFTRRRKRST